MLVILSRLPAKICIWMLHIKPLMRTDAFKGVEKQWPRAGDPFSARNITEDEKRTSFEISAL